MTKKDFILITSVLNQYARCERDNIIFTMDDIIASFSVRLSSLNPRFNKDKFYLACYSTKEI
jgi:hypothetical protein